MLSLAVTVLFWFLRFGHQLCQDKSLKTAFEILPSFHWRVMWLPGLTAGCLWSVGNVGSIVAVEHLGQGVRLIFLTVSIRPIDYVVNLIPQIMSHSGWLLGFTSGPFDKVSS